jgi:hypothetical protein
LDNKFKDDVAKLLDTLTNTGAVVLNNNKLELVPNDMNKKIVPTDYFKQEYEYTQTYDNINLIEFIKNQIDSCKKSNWNKYVKKHVMYFFVITLDDPDNKNRILCKIGYSYDLIERFKSLRYEYKCKFYLLGVKLVRYEQDEKDFHPLLKNKFPEFPVNIKLGNHYKDETYVFDIELYKTFLSYEDKVPFTDSELDIEKESQEIINNYFKNIEDNFENEIRMKTTLSIKNISNEHQADVYSRYYDNLTKQFEIEQKEKTKQIEIIEKTKQIDIEQKEKTKQMKQGNISKIIESGNIVFDIETIKLLFYKD